VQHECETFDNRERIAIIIAVSEMNSYKDASEKCKALNATPAKRVEIERGERRSLEVLDSCRFMYKC